MRTRLIFVRHAEAEGNLYREFHGWTDSPITEKGHKQAELVAKRLKDVNIDVLYSSSLKRTLQTAQYIADVKIFQFLEPINEGNKRSRLEGKKWDELAQLWPLENETWEKRPHLHKMPTVNQWENFKRGF
jgi:probable phosphoglycerate mutase